VLLVRQDAQVAPVQRQLAASTPPVARPPPCVAKSSRRLPSFQKVAGSRLAQPEAHFRRSLPQISCPPHEAGATGVHYSPQLSRTHERHGDVRPLLRFPCVVFEALALCVPREADLRRLLEGDSQKLSDSKRPAIQHAHVNGKLYSKFDLPAQSSVASASAT
jgi:hypothetical protein